MRQRKPASEDPSKATAANNKAATTGNDVTVPTATGTEETVISPELRSLLSRKVEKLDKKTVVEHGGGVG